MNYSSQDFRSCRTVLNIRTVMKTTKQLDPDKRYPVIFQGSFSETQRVVEP
jgi:hypothetical protein